MPIANRTRRLLRLTTLLCMGLAPVLQAAEPITTSDGLPIGHYRLPADGDVIGKVQTTTSEHEETLIQIGHRYGVGFEEMRRANPKLNMWLPGDGTEVTVPTRFILPPGPREGVVVNVGEMRLYYYPPANEGEPRQVETYPISVGRMDWKTPLGTTRIIDKIENPLWYPPESIIKEHAERGDNLPSVVPAGPDNPLGKYKMRLGIPGYLIHGTNKPQGVGMRVTHGCIRMLPEDIEQLFPRLPVGTNVRLINDTFKLGWSNDILYVQAYPGLEEQANTPISRVTDALSAVASAVEGREYPVDYGQLREEVESPSGVPVALQLLDMQPRYDRFADDPSLYGEFYLVADPYWWEETQKAPSQSTGPS
ncbi:L,D-transpeptidase family protein [Halomonas sp. HP20-15]|uniref:L,D-transpeptidase family protein n=1 Tax=Halomonas sp. HP20-15 TaxID=3085901 RepID=UPI00298175B0|nr:L,D-transpeptidase family protein [Halomonas sp. HP20-15]MDW5376939.1 L,D-transpeptidase family protein [Halomonas sp. HP20-15]